MNVSRFEDLIAWQKARELAREIYVTSGNERFRKDFSLADQIRRAGVSIMSNIAEGFERGTPSEFYHFLTIAKASCAEVRSQLYLALDIGYLDGKRFSELSRRAEEVAKIIGGLRTAVGAKRIKK